MKEEKDICYDIPVLESLQNLMNSICVSIQWQCHRLNPLTSFYSSSSSLAVANSYSS